MHAIILAGGKGTRLRPITDCIPKALVSVGGKPILEWQVIMLAKSGIKDIIIATGYKSDLIEDYVKSRKGFGSKITISCEKTPLGTGGAICAATNPKYGKCRYWWKDSFKTRQETSDIQCLLVYKSCYPLDYFFDLIHFIQTLSHNSAVRYNIHHRKVAHLHVCYRVNFH